jgi:hypothetical protein
MVYTYSYNTLINDVGTFFQYLKDGLPLVQSLTCDCVNENDHTHDTITITIYTDVELSNDDQNALQTLIDDYPNPMYNVNVNAFRRLSVINSTSVPLYPNCSFYGEWEDVSNYSTITVFVATDHPSASKGLEFQFSTDAEHTDFIKYLDVGENGCRNQVTVACQYFKIAYTNGQTKSNVRIQTMYHHYRNKAIGTNASQSITDSMDCEVTRAILNGRIENGTYIPINVTAEGHLETTIHGPSTAFGELSISPNIPVLQHDFVYSVDPNFWQIYQQNDANVRQDQGMAVCSSAGKQNSMATIRSRRTLRYRPGQGCLGRYTAMFDTPQDGNYQIAGFGNPEAGLFFGYFGTNFGIIYTSKNVRQLHTITILAKSDDVQTATVVLGGISYSVPVTAGATEATTAWEIASYDYASTSYPGWIMSAVGSTIHVGCIQAGLQSGEFSVAFETSGEASITQEWAGSSTTTQFFPQSAWNIDRLDGTASIMNPSSSLLQPSKGNIFYVKFQYLGFGYIEFGIEDPLSTEMNPVHRILYANYNNVPNLTNPTLPFVMSSRNTTCSTSVSVRSASCAGFVQGKVHKLGTQSSFTQPCFGVTTSPTHVFTIRSSLLYQGRYNMKQIIPNILNVCNFGSNFVQVDIIRYCTLDNNTNFTAMEPNSIVEIDTSCQIVTGGQVKYSTGITPGQTMTIDLEDIEMTVEQNSVMTVVAKTFSGETDVSCSLTYAED